MSLWSYLDKPKYLSTLEKENVTPTNKGWVYTYQDGREEILVSIGRLPDKQKPRISDIIAIDDVEFLKVNEYNIEKTAYMNFKLFFSFPVIHNLTSETKLSIKIDNVDYYAEYGWDDENDGFPIFYFTIPETLNDKNLFIPYDTIYENIIVNGIILNTGEFIQLNHNDYINENSIDAILDCPDIIEVNIIRPLIPPEIINIGIMAPSGLTFGGYYTSEPKIKIIITFDVNIDATTLTQLSILNFSIVNSNIIINLIAEFSEIRGVRQIQFDYDIPITQLERDAIIPPDTTDRTTIIFNDIILNSGEHISFYDPDHPIDANLSISNTLKEYQIFISNPS